MKHLFIAVVMFTAIPKLSFLSNDEPAFLQKQPLMCPKGWVRVECPHYHDVKESVDGGGFKYYKTISKTKRVLVGIEIHVKDMNMIFIYWDSKFLSKVK